MTLLQLLELRLQKHEELLQQIPKPEAPNKENKEQFIQSFIQISKNKENRDQHIGAISELKTLIRLCKGETSGN